VRSPALIRLAPARAIRREQAYAMECLIRLTQPPEAGPLIWARTPGGHQLATWYLPDQIENGRRTGST
jgi:hypothetical protein